MDKKIRTPAFRMKGKGIELITYLKVYDSKLLLRHIQKTKTDILEKFTADKTDAEQLQKVIKEIEEKTVPDIGSELLSLTILMATCSKLMKMEI